MALRGKGDLRQCLGQLRETIAGASRDSTLETLWTSVSGPREPRSPTGETDSNTIIIEDLNPPLASWADHPDRKSIQQ